MSRDPPNGPQGTGTGEANARDTDPAGPALLPLPPLHRNTADELALLLASQRIDVRLRAAGRGYSLEVSALDVEAAHALVRGYVEERAEDRAEDERQTRIARLSKPAAPPSPVGLAVGFALIGVHQYTGGWSDESALFAVGNADAFRIVEQHELWRCVTALSLHSDWGHVLANALSGTLFIGFVGRSLGPGLGLLLVLLAGALGNLANAIHHGAFHHSVGASTAVFGALGLLSGLAAARRERGRYRHARFWLPLAAALGILAMLGTGGARVDYGAHLYGMAMGMGLGFLAALGTRKANPEAPDISPAALPPAPPGALVQLGCAGAAAGLMAISWMRALA